MAAPKKVPLWFFLLFLPVLWFLPETQAWTLGVLVVFATGIIYWHNKQYYGWFYWKQKELTKEGKAKFDIDRKKEGVRGVLLTLSIILLINIFFIAIEFWQLYKGAAHPPLLSNADTTLWAILSVSAGIALITRRPNALLVLAIFLAYDFITSGAVHLLQGKYESLPLLVFETGTLVMYLLYSYRVKNTYPKLQLNTWIVAIAAVAAIVSWILVAAYWEDVTLREKARYEFNDENNQTFDGQVWINNSLYGNTSNGLIYVDYITQGNVSIETLIENRTENITFTIGEEDEALRHMYLTVNLSEWSTSAYIDPYMSAIALQDTYMRSLAVSAAGDCRSKECRAAYIYDFVTRNNTYLSDPRSREHIQLPEETLDLGAGDCEDLTILLVSLFESSGIETKVVFTPGHVYALACGLDEDKLRNYTTEVLTRVSVLDEFTEYSPISSYGGEYYGAYTNYSEVYYNLTIKSNKPVEVIAFASEEDMGLWWKDEEYFLYEACTYREVEELETICALPGETVIEIYNPNENTAQVRRTIQIYGVVEPEYYTSATLANQSTFDEDCFIMDPTAGAGSYIGYDNNITTEKQIVDPITRVYEFVE
jgi:transglutaminase-like putative cysteine protease